MYFYLFDPESRYVSSFDSIEKSFKKFEMIHFYDFQKCFNQIIIKKPDVLIIDIRSKTATDLDRISKVCHLYEIPVMFVGSKNQNLFELSMDEKSIFVYDELFDKCLLENLRNLIAARKKIQVLYSRISNLMTGKLPFIVKSVIAFLFFEPLFKILFLARMSGYSLEMVLDNISNMPWGLSFFEFWFLFPLSGVLLLLFRKIGFFIFVGMQVYLIYALTVYEQFTWPYLSRNPHPSTFLLLAMNLLVIFYVLSSYEMKQLLSMAKIWWRKHPRYKTDIQCQLVVEDEMVPTVMMDISQSGALLVDNNKSLLGEKYTLSSQTQYDFEFLIEVVNKRKHGDLNVMGVRILTGNSKQIIRNLLKNTSSSRLAGDNYLSM